MEGELTRCEHKCGEVSLGKRKKTKIFLGCFSLCGENNDSKKGNYEEEVGRLVR